jgi:hypothetical protein
MSWLGETTFRDNPLFFGSEQGTEIMSTTVVDQQEAATQKVAIQFTYGIQTPAKTSILNQLSSIDNEFQEYLIQRFKADHPAIYNVKDASSMIGVSTALSYEPDYCTKRHFLAKKSKACAIATCTASIEYYSRPPVDTSTSADSSLPQATSSRISADHIQYDLLVAMQSFFQEREEKSSQQQVELMLLGPLPAATQVRMELASFTDNPLSSSMGTHEIVWFQERMLDFANDAVSFTGSSSTSEPIDISPLVVFVTQQHFGSPAMLHGLDSDVTSRSGEQLENAETVTSMPTNLMVTAIVSYTQSSQTSDNDGPSIIEQLFVQGSRPKRLGFSSNPLSLIHYLQTPPADAEDYLSFAAVQKSIQYFDPVQSIVIHPDNPFQRSAALYTLCVVLVVTCAFFGMAFFAWYSTQSFGRKTTRVSSPTKKLSLSGKKALQVDLDEASVIKPMDTIRNRTPRPLSINTTSEEAMPLSPSSEQPTSTKSQPGASPSIFERLTPSFFSRARRGGGSKTTRAAVAPVSSPWNMSEALDDEEIEPLTPKFKEGATKDIFSPTKDSKQD